MTGAVIEKAADQDAFRLLDATELLPVSWVGSPPPFDVCWRQGQLGESWVNRSGFAGLARDLAVLVGWPSGEARTWPFVRLKVCDEDGFDLRPSHG